MVARPPRTPRSAASPRARRRPQLLAASYAAGGRLLRAVPPGLSHAVAAPGGTAWYWLSPGQRRAALENYAAVLGLPASDPHVARVAKTAFQNYGRMLVDFLRMAGLTPEELIARTTVDGREHFDTALARGRGAIMAVPHMGSWDMSGAYAAAIGYKAVAVTDPFPGSLNDAVVRTRLRYGLQVISTGRAAVRTLTDTLRANGVIGLVCDLQHGPGVEVDFFGRRAVVPAGPAALALKTGAALIPISQHATAPGRQHIHLDPALSVTAADTKESLMQRVVDRFEVFIRERPEQWYAFRRMFRG
jgi:phosphatidylinositol dimannoside acyltransferase